MEQSYNLLDVSEREKFITNYKAVYQAMTAKHDCKSKIFPRNVKIYLEDIKDLNDRVVTKLRNYNEAGFSISVNVSFVGRQTIEFSSWNEFEEHSWNESDAINSITIIWEFNALLPQYEVPQKHVLVVKMTDGLRPEEMINIVFAGKLENIEDIEKQMYPVVARVDFINFTLGDELIHIVEMWNNSLESQIEEPHYVQVIRKHKRKIAFLLNYITDFVILICFIKIAINALYGFGFQKISELAIDNVSELALIIGLLVMIFILIDKISVWLSNTFYKTLGMEKEWHVFSINKGDDQIQKKLNGEYRQSKWITIGSVLGTFLVNLICTVICSFIV